MPIDLQIIRANEFICLDTDELLDFEASKQLLRGLAFACRKRGLERAMIDLRSLPVPVRPHFTLAQIAALVGTFREAGFTRKQRLAILYSHDVHRGIRNFAFFSKMRGLQVHPFLDFETAVYWLSEGMEDPSEMQPGTPIPIAKSGPKKKTVFGRTSARCADATGSLSALERKTGMKTKYRLAGVILFAATALAIHAQTLGGT